MGVELVGWGCSDPSGSVRGAALPEVTPRLRRGGAHPAAFLVTKENLEQKKPTEPGGEEASVVPQGELCLQKHLNCAKRPGLPLAWSGRILVVRLTWEPARVSGQPRAL